MTRNKVLYPIRIFFTSLGAGLLLLLIACYCLNDFSSQAIFESMFWVGALLLVAGAIFFVWINPHLGASIAIATQLRYDSNGKWMKRSDRNTREGYVRGVLIAIPGIIMIGISYFVLA